jgi:hypothetical protein
MRTSWRRRSNWDRSRAVWRRAKVAAWIKFRAVSMWYAGLAVDDEDPRVPAPFGPVPRTRGELSRVRATRDQSVGNTLHT